MPDFTKADRELLRLVADWSGPKRFHFAELDERLLCELSSSRGVDFATALLFQTILDSAEHGPFLQRMEGLLRQAPAFDGRLDARLVIVPGAFYREYPETGADGKSLCQVAESWGCRTHVVPTRSVGSPAVNGRILCDELLDIAECHIAECHIAECDAAVEPIILCSLSKGGADVKMALAQPDAPRAFRHVVAWLNVGGTTDGSPMVRWVLDRPWVAMLYRMLFWLRRQDFRFVTDLDRRTGSLLDFEITPPAHWRIIHVLGFPLARHVRRAHTRRWHRRLACCGPNDGATVLSDSCRLPGLVFPVWGADHYLDAQHRPETLLAALLRYLGEELNLVSHSRRVGTAAAR